MSGCGCKKPQQPTQPVQTSQATNEAVVNAVKKTVEKYYQKTVKK